VKWAYGVTTVTMRINNGSLNRTLKSLEAAGFDKPRLFVDGCSPSEWQDSLIGKGPDGTFSDYEITLRYPNVRTAGNWVLTLHELLIRDPNADRYAIFQDDFVTYLGLKSYLENCEYPAKGYWNLYTFPVNQQLAPKDGSTGWFLANQCGQGAVALIFNRETVITLLSSRHLIERPLDASRGHCAIDGGIVTALAKAGWREYCHHPSLVQHTGMNSSMSNKVHPLATSFRGEEFDLMTLLGADAKRIPIHRNQPINPLNKSIQVLREDVILARDRALAYVKSRGLGEQEAQYVAEFVNRFGQKYGALIPVTPELDAVLLSPDIQQWVEREVAYQDAKAGRR
jgi:hypothetical protein